MLVLRIDKWGLDDAHKDKQNKLYSSDFKVSVFLHRVSSEHAVLPPGGQDWQCSRQFQDTTPSESSEAESTESDEEEDGWESGDSAERMVGRYRLLSNPPDSWQAFPS
uniref:Uncharacterized protein n=1 Tax=Timema shepardi TaxID=629360 RepID=A0A7R9B3E9_TIMSH|nr:unnamed protein product [Timema shepardi]